MLFNSYIFIFAFLQVTFIGFFAIGKLGKQQVVIAWLVAASLFFYGWWNPNYLGLILISIIFNYTLGIALGRMVPSATKKRFLAARIVGNLVL